MPPSSTGRPQKHPAGIWKGSFVWPTALFLLNTLPFFNAYKLLFLFFLWIGFLFHTLDTRHIHQVALDYFSDFSLVLDLLRAKIIVADFSEMNLVLGILAAHAGIVIVSVKNRTGIFFYQNTFFSWFVLIFISYILGCLIRWTGRQALSWGLYGQLLPCCWPK